MKEIFVFGSNLAGKHGKGAALDAKRYHGAKQNQAEGLQGDSYAIPTKDKLLGSLPLNIIQYYVNRFISFAKLHSNDITFVVTRIGCGLAGYTDRQIGPMFASVPDNCRLPEEWHEYKLPKVETTII